MPHKYLSNKSKNSYIIRIMTNLEFNDEVYSVSELKSYTTKELKKINSMIKPEYNNIAKRNNPMYVTLY